MIVDWITVGLTYLLWLQRFSRFYRRYRKRQGCRLACSRRWSAKNMGATYKSGVSRPEHAVRLSQPAPVLRIRWRIEAKLIMYLVYINVYSVLIAGAVASNDLGESDQVSWEIKIKNDIFTSYDSSSRPVRNDSETTTVTIGISLYHILDTDEKYQTITTLNFIRMRWVDHYLKWNRSNYGNLSRVYVKASNVWRPDIAISNNADLQSNQFPLGNVIVHDDGRVLFMTQTVARTYCVLNVRYFPFDKQSCPIKFVSSTYNGIEVDMVKEPGDNFSYYNQENQEWSLENITVVRHEITYACCPEPYPDITFTLNLKRRSLFYIFNLIFPCILIYVLSFTVFFLPCESNEKVTMEITVLLATMVFLMVINETLPPTPDAIPLLGLLFTAITLIVSIALVMAVCVTNVYYRQNGHFRMPPWIRMFVLNRWMRLLYATESDANYSRGWTGSRPTGVQVGSDGAQEMELVPNHNPLRTMSPAQLRRARLSGHYQSSLCNFESAPTPSSLLHDAATRDRPYEPLMSAAFLNQNSVNSSNLPSRCPSCGGHYPVPKVAPLASSELDPSLRPHYNLNEPLSDVLFKEEWKMLAQRLDVFFFWLLLIFGTSLLFAIFVSIPD